jgi:hypothetical protein
MRSNHSSVTDVTIARIEAAEWLDGPSYTLASALALPQRLAGAPGKRTRSALHGTWYGHPVHRCSSPSRSAPGHWLSGSTRSGRTKAGTMTGQPISPCRLEPLALSRPPQQGGLLQMLTQLKRSQAGVLVKPQRGIDQQ